MQDSKIPVLSFFSGAGFMDLGFLRQGAFNVVWHNECYRPFAQAYEHGIGAFGYNTTNNKIQSQARLETLTSKQIAKQAFPKGKPSLFGVIGGPPCPDFSIAGKNRGRDGSNGKLTKQYLDMVKDLEPSFFLLENVPGLLETRKHRLFLFELLEGMCRDYAIDLRILDALEYGVPQSRRRLFVIGVNLEWLRGNMKHQVRQVRRKVNALMKCGKDEPKTNKKLAAELKEFHWFGWPEPSHPGAHSKRPIPKELTVAASFAKFKGHPNSGDQFRPYSPRIRTIEEGDVSRKSFKRLSHSSYSPNASYGNNEVHLHPKEDRRISVAEALSLQSVPPEYSFPAEMTLTSKFKAIGNGVPVKLAEELAQSVAKFIKKGGM